MSGDKLPAFSAMQQASAVVSFEEDKGRMLQPPSEYYQDVVFLATHLSYIDLIHILWVCCLHPDRSRNSFRRSWACIRI